MKRMWSKNELKSINQNQASSGELKNVKVFEEIVDKEGHKRFVEGNGTPEEITGVTVSFCKWSLSGTHLMIVFAGEIADTTALTTQYLAQFDLPEWILNKIVPVWGDINIQEKRYNLIDDEWSSSQEILLVFRKNEDGVSIMNIGSFTADADRPFRFTLDLLIDNE